MLRVSRAAFGKRPFAYLHPEVKQATSPFSKVKNLTAGLQKLKGDHEHGTWVQNNKAILNLPALDVGYVVITDKVRNG